MFVVALKINGKVNPLCYGGYTYLKTRPVEYCSFELTKDNRLPVPQIGYRYSACNLVTTPVVSYKSYENGWEVQTRNSLYRFFISNGETVESIAKENGFTGPRKIDDDSQSEFWSQSFS